MISLYRLLPQSRRNCFRISLDSKLRLRCCTPTDNVDLQRICDSSTADTVTRLSFRLLSIQTRSATICRLRRTSRAIASCYFIQSKVVRSSDA